MSNQKYILEGLIIRTFPYSEADLILRIMTAQRGKVSAIAKFARKSKKRFPGSFDLCDYGNFEIKPGSGELLLITAFTPTKSNFGALRNNIQKLVVASLFCEACDLLFPEEVQEGPIAFSMLLAALNEISAPTYNPAQLVELANATLHQLLVLSGFRHSASTAKQQERVSNHGTSLLKFLIGEIESACNRAVNSKTAVNDVL